MKKLLILFLTAALALSLCACGGGEDAVDSGPTAPTEDAAAPTEGTQGDSPAEEPTPTPGPEATAVNLGDTIDLDFVKVTLDTLDVTKEGYHFEYTEGNVTYQSSVEPDRGMSMVCLRGKFTNKTNAEVYPSNDPLYSVFTINGNEYKGQLKCYLVDYAESCMGVAAQQEVDYFCCAQVPENVAADIQTCSITFGFQQDIVTGYIGGVDELDYVYTLDAIPTAV